MTLWLRRIALTLFATAGFAFCLSILADEATRTYGLFGVWWPTFATITVIELTIVAGIQAWIAWEDHA